MSNSNENVGLFIITVYCRPIAYLLPVIPVMKAAHRNNRPPAQTADKTSKILRTCRAHGTRKAPTHCSTWSDGWCKVQGSPTKKVFCSLLNVQNCVTPLRINQYQQPVRQAHIFIFACKYIPFKKKGVDIKKSFTSANVLTTSTNVAPIIDISAIRNLGIGASQVNN